MIWLCVALVVGGVGCDDGDAPDVPDVREAPAVAVVPAVARRIASLAARPPPVLAVAPAAVEEIVDDPEPIDDAALTIIVEPDTDGDDIPDVDDRCPDEPDGSDVDDGCPEIAPPLSEP